MILQYCKGKQGALEYSKTGHNILKMAELSRG